MNIRRAQASDLEAIAKLEAICFPKAEAADLACFKERFSVFGDCFWVLEDEGEIIGFINGMCVNERVIRDELFENASLHCENGAYQSVFGLDVHPDHRGKRLSALLMDALIADARQRKRKGCILTCKDHLIPFYESFGYRLLGVSASVHGGAKWNDMILEF
ncbi:GNAT family N-acetyltransferase [Massilicoli timonensis]|uniref:GNAT family N-acetyltransferase n=1 Tax=Massilicoli timonensis TaxID=2015901 RepID=A0ABT1SNY2_9FIRM|nr:GNAT family N-acetyltransferase [Massilicoli timonensis]MCQ5122693.1 GNAT family N-acetyltransferase [Massilicoli timonensis]